MMAVSREPDAGRELQPPRAVGARMPAEPQIARRLNQLTFGLNGGSDRYSETISPPRTPPHPTTLERLETISCPAQGVVAAEPPAEPAAGYAKMPLRTMICQIKQMNEHDWASGKGPNDYQLSPIEENYRHGFWAARRKRVYDALVEAGVSPRRRENYAQCGSNAWVLQNSRDGAIKTTGAYCHDRFCQACQQSRAGRIARALNARVPTQKCLHVVLTLRSNDQPLGEQLDRLYKASAKLRARKWWRSRAAGGSQTLELTRNTTTGQWHPHLHILVHAEWLKHQELSDEWHAVTGDSTIVHVSLVANSAAAVREVTKYLSKPIHRSIDFDRASLVTLIHALKGRRLIGTFGTWRKDPLLTDEAPDPDDDWHAVCSLHTLHAQASRGDTWAREAMRYLTSLHPGRQPVTPPAPRPSG